MRILVQMPTVCATCEIERKTLRPNPVGRWSAEGEGITVSVEDMNFKTELTRNLQVPPRPPKKVKQTAWSALFFMREGLETLHHILPQKLKPWFSTKGQPGFLDKENHTTGDYE